MLSLYNVGIKLKEAKSTEHYCSVALLPLLFSLSSPPPLHLSTLVFVFFHPLFFPHSSPLFPLLCLPLLHLIFCFLFSSFLFSTRSSSFLFSTPFSTLFPSFLFSYFILFSTLFCILLSTLSPPSYSRTPQSPRVTTTVTKAARNSPAVTEPTSIPVPVARMALSGTKRLRSVSLEKLPASLTAKRPSRTPTQDTTPVERPPTLRTGGNEGMCTFTARVRACNSNRSL